MNGGEKFVDDCTDRCVWQYRDNVRVVALVENRVNLFDDCFVVEWHLWVSSFLHGKHVSILSEGL